jgi:hypothetical protein
VDGFIADSIQPNTTVNQVTAVLDGLLNQQGSPSVAIMANLPTGPFLILGVGLQRGGPFNLEDALSFRAYQNQSGKFVCLYSLLLLMNRAFVVRPPMLQA